MSQKEIFRVMLKRHKKESDFHCSLPAISNIEYLIAITVSNWNSLLTKHRSYQVTKLHFGEKFSYKFGIVPCLFSCKFVTSN